VPAGVEEEESLLGFARALDDSEEPVEEESEDVDDESDDDSDDVDEPEAPVEVFCRLSLR
jgi:hypothetical protein